MATSRTLALAIPLLLAPATPLVAPVGDALPRATTSSPRASFGPPWLSIEYPANPYDPTTRDAFLVVNAFHHGTPVAFPVAGTAEGIVEGRRRSVALTFTRTSRTGAYALSRQWPNDGTWSLVISVSQGAEDKVTAVVDLSASGDVAAVRIPTRRQDGHTIPAPVSMSSVEASLRERAAQRSASRGE